MEKISEYIPIIIILATVIFSIIGKMKKPQTVVTETAHPMETDEESDEIWDFPQTAGRLNNKNIEEKMKKPAFGKAEIIKKKAIVPSFSTETVTVESEEEKLYPHFSLEEEEDLVKAIIYSEIINKKEY